MAQRANGFYWVKYNDETEFEPAKFEDGFWQNINNDRELTDNYFDEIDERPIVHEPESV